MTAGQDLATWSPFSIWTIHLFSPRLQYAHAAVFLARKVRAEAIYQNDEVEGKQLLSFTEIPAGFRSFKKVENVASN